MKCSACGSDIEAADKFCAACGEALTTTEPIPANETADAHSTAAISGGERRQVTALFADVVGSTPLGEKIGEEALFRFMQGVITEMTQAVQNHGGTIEKHTGDGVMGLFGAPLAVEDAPLNACRAGLDIISRVAAIGDDLEQSHGDRPHVRIGVNTGHAVVGSLGDDLQQEVTALGDSVNVAARLEALAETDTMVVGETTHQLVADYVEAEFAGEHQVKGKTDAQPIWRIDSLKPGVRRFDASLRRGLTTLVGRREELEDLLERMAAIREGKPQTIDIVGETGLGKSRLVHEFRQRLSADDILWLQGNCTAGGRTTAFRPFIEVVRASFGVSETDSDSTVERRLARGLEVLGLSASEGVPYLLNLLGREVEGSEFTRGNAEVAGIRTRNLLQRMLIERCRMSPVVLHIDDLHWLDQASEELLALMVEKARDLPILMLFTFRPEYSPPWAGSDKVVRHTLKPLTTGGTEELLRHRLGVDDLPAALIRLVGDKAEGNPLYAEEILNYLSDRGALEEAGEEDLSSLPVSLENILMARVDGLEEEPRVFLQAASVIGRQFAADVAGEVAGPNGGGAASLAALQRVELVRPDEDSGDYLFKSALIQEAVYNSLMSDRREVLHERAADAMERRNPDRLGEIVETLAHHYGHSPRAEKAVQYMAQAGEKSLRVYSLDEAELRLRQVIELIEKVPGCADDAFLIDVLLNMARVQYYRADMYGLIELLEPHLGRAEALGDQKRLARMLFEIGYAHVFSANIEVGEPMLDRARAIGEENDDELIQGYVAVGLLWGHGMWHERDEHWLATCQRLSEEGERIGRKYGDNWLTAKSIVGLGTINDVGGYPGEARKHGLRMFDLSRETNDPRPSDMGHWLIASTDLFHFVPEEAVSSGREGARLALSIVDKSLSEFFMAGGLIMTGQAAEGLPTLRRIADMYVERGMLLPLPGTLSFIGLGMVQEGDIADGMAQIQGCKDFFVNLKSDFGVATVDLVLGEIYTRMALGQDTPPLGVMLRNIGFLLRTLPRVSSLARRHLGSSLAYFRKVKTTSYAAWALYDLALLDRKKGRKEDASRNFSEARDLAQSVESLVLVEMIDEALKSA